MWAIDSSPAMNEYLRVKALSAGLANIETVLASAVSLPLIDGRADLAVSNYCFHELRHADKQLALAEAMRVLKPGGRLVLGDMMFSFNPWRLVIAAWWAPSSAHWRAAGSRESCGC